MSIYSNKGNHQLLSLIYYCMRAERVKTLCSNATGSKNKNAQQQLNTTKLLQQYNTAFAMRPSNNQDKKQLKEESEEEELSEGSTSSEEDIFDGICKRICKAKEADALSG